MKETQRSVGAWADSTFGPTDPTHAHARACEEMNEFISARGSHPHRLMTEAADVVITLYRLAEVLSYNLHAEIDAKMAINRKRRWQPDGTGNGYHIKGTES